MTKNILSREISGLIAVLGAGAMGRGIAEVALAAGHAVIIYNHKASTLEAAAATIQTNLARRVEKGRLQLAESQAQLDRLQLSTELADIRNAALVIESVSEDLEIKRGLLDDAEQIVSAEAILATNTSSISISKLSAGLLHPQRFLGLHFFNPAPVMKLVEIIPGNRTNSQVIEAVEALVRRWDKRSVTCKSTPGFLVNRIARPFYVEAFRLLDEGFDPPKTIDAALKKAGGFRMGPFELTDLIGQDVNFQVTQQIWESMGYDPKYTPTLHQRSLVESGLLGRKTGAGIYGYADTGRVDAEDPVQIGQAPIFSGSITVYGETGVLAPLVDAVRRSGVAVKTADATPLLVGSIGIDGGPLLRLTDGRSAEQIAVQLGRNVVLLDLALDYASVDHLLFSANRAASIHELEEVHSFLNLAGIREPKLIDDTPGLVVARIVACLINEAAALVQQRISTLDEVETAAKLGVNYPLGLLEWRDRIGEGWVESVMRNLSELLHPTRYRPTPSFSRTDVGSTLTSLAS